MMQNKTSIGYYELKHLKNSQNLSPEMGALYNTFD